MIAANFGIGLLWGRNVQSPEALASRFLDTLAALEALGGGFRTWYVCDSLNEQVIPLVAARSDMVDIVRRNVTRDDDDEPEPQSGYWMSAVNQMDGPVSKGLAVLVKGGATYSNSAFFNVSHFREATDPSLVTYPVFRAILLTLIAHWPCDSARAWAASIEPERDEPDRPLGVPYVVVGRPHYAWMGYVSKSFSTGVGPIQDLHTERTPDGGLLMSAALETFDPAAPAHVKAALRLEKIWNALRPPNK